MAAILFIDDDPNFLEAISEYFEDLADRVTKGDKPQVFSALGARRAVPILKAQKIAVVVTEIKLVEMDGIAFLGVLAKHFPQMTKIVLTTVSADEQREACMSAGAMVYLEKPKTREEIQDRYQSIKAILDSSITDYRQARNNEEFRSMVFKYCTKGNKNLLFVKANGVTGRIYVHDGQIVHAMFGKSLGVNALREMMSLPKAELKHDEYEAPKTQTVVSGTWEQFFADTAANKAVMPTGDASQFTGKFLVPKGSSGTGMGMRSPNSGTGNPVAKPANSVNSASGNKESPLLNLNNSSPLLDTSAISAPKPPLRAAGGTPMQPRPSGTSIPTSPATNKGPGGGTSMFSAPGLGTPPGSTAIPAAPGRTSAFTPPASGIRPAAPPSARLVAPGSPSTTPGVASTNVPSTPSTPSTPSQGISAPAGAGSGLVSSGTPASVSMTIASVRPDSPISRNSGQLPAIAPQASGQLPSVTSGTNQQATTGSTALGGSGNPVNTGQAGTIGSTVRRPAAVIPSMIPSLGNPTLRPGAILGARLATTAPAAPPAPTSPAPSVSAPKAAVDDAMIEEYVVCTDRLRVLKTKNSVVAETERHLDLIQFMSITLELLKRELRFDNLRHVEVEGEGFNAVVCFRGDVRGYAVSRSSQFGLEDLVRAFDPVLDSCRQRPAQNPGTNAGIKA